MFSNAHTRPVRPSHSKKILPAILCHARRIFANSMNPVDVEAAPYQQFTGAISPPWAALPLPVHITAPGGIQPVIVPN